ncbi:glycosyl transferase [Infundibulicybe gibba]|nr:glycosyl transferase [Infundibulicybe gibba]
MLNDEEFTDEFKKGVSALTRSSMEFGVVPREHWNQPDWIDEEKATAGRAALKEADIIYAESVSYRNMCRFNSGFFFKHPLMQKYRYYWRIEPDVHFHCDVDFDPFLLMQDEKKTYGFTIAVYEFRETVLSLWGHVKDFIKEHPEFVAEENSAMFLSDDGGDKYNLCHFWSNFEIADMEFWRGPAYTAFFEYLESKGGFYYERWGDAPVHSIAAAFSCPRKNYTFSMNRLWPPSLHHCPQTEQKEPKDIAHVTHIRALTTTDTPA